MPALTFTPCQRSRWTTPCQIDYLAIVPIYIPKAFLWPNERKASSLAAGKVQSRPKRDWGFLTAKTGIHSPFMFFLLGGQRIADSEVHVLSHDLQIIHVEGKLQTARCLAHEEVRDC